jgi:ribosomal protein L30E
VKVNWKKELQAAVKEGRVVLGLARTLRSLKGPGGKFVVVSRDCPEADTIKQYAKLAGVDLFEFTGSGSDLGATVKKPFSVSAVLVK